jgi:hypothetical protein
MNNLAWDLATNPDAKKRNGTKAIELALRACSATQYKQAIFIGTLAAAYAEAGRFEDAIKTAAQAQSLAAAEGQKELATRNAELLNLYRARVPYHEELMSRPSQVAQPR